MSTAQQLAQLAAEAAAIYANYEVINNEWEAALEAAGDGDAEDDANLIAASIARLEQVGPQRLAILVRIEEIETLSEQLFEAAKDEFEKTIQPARDQVSDVYSEVPLPDDDWKSEIEFYRDAVAEIQSGARGSPEQLSRRRAPMPFFRVG